MSVQSAQTKQTLPPHTTNRTNNSNTIMASLPQTTTNPKTETPSNSETAEHDSVATTNASSADKQPVKGSSSQPGSAEAAADKLYEERIEEEYAKREGGA